MSSALRVQLHLFRPDTEVRPDDPGLETMELGPQSKLSEFYREYFCPVYLVGTRPATRDLYAQSVGHWVRITGDPAICEITRRTTADFFAELLQTVSFKSGQSFAPRTVLHHAARLNAILDATGPSSRGNEDAADLLPRAPWISTRAVSVPNTLPAGDYTVEEVGQMLAGAAKMRTSKFIEKLTPRTFWTLFVAGSYYLGEHRAEMLGIKLEDISGNHVNIPARTKTGKPNRKILHPAIEAIVRATWSTRVYLLPWLDWHADDWSRALNSRRQFDARFSQLQRVSKITPARMRLGTRGFRKAHLTALAEGSLTDAQLSANHADLAVTLGYYVSGLVQTRKRQDTVDRAIGHLPTVRANGADGAG